MVVRARDLRDWRGWSGTDRLRPGGGRLVRTALGRALRRGPAPRCCLAPPRSCQAVAPAAIKNTEAAPVAPLRVQGLDAAGKTTILYKLKLGEIVTTIPTIGALGHSLLPSSILFRSIEAPCRRWGLHARRLQRGDRGVQKHQLHRVGCGRAGQGAPRPASKIRPHHPACASNSAAASLRRGGGVPAGPPPYGPGQ